MKNVPTAIVLPPTYDHRTSKFLTQVGVRNTHIRLELTVRDPAEMERAVLAFARASNGGLIVIASGLAFIHRSLIIELAAQ